MEYISPDLEATEGVGYAEVGYAEVSYAGYGVKGFGGGFGLRWLGCAARRR